MFLNHYNTMELENEKFNTDNEDTNQAAGHLVTIPVLAETVKVDKQQIETGRIKIKKETKEVEETINISLTKDEYNIERVPINKYVDEAPPVRHEGNTMIVPVLKEVMVKRLMVTEEIHIRHNKIETTETQNVVLRQEQLTINRIPSKQDK